MERICTRGEDGGERVVMRLLVTFISLSLLQLLKIDLSALAFFCAPVKRSVVQTIFDRSGLHLTECPPDGIVYCRVL